MQLWILVASFEYKEKFATTWLQNRKKNRSLTEKCHRSCLERPLLPPPWAPVRRIQADLSSRWSRNRQPVGAPNAEVHDDEPQSCARATETGAFCAWPRSLPARTPAYRPRPFLGQASERAVSLALVAAARSAGEFSRTASASSTDSGRLRGSGGGWRTRGRISWLCSTWDVRSTFLAIPFAYFPPSSEQNFC